MLNTPGAVLLGIVYGYLPLMIMPIYVSLEKLDRRLLDASADLGAKPVSTFLSVTLPLSMPGVMTGMALVTILLLGEYLIPQLLGGGKVFFIGNALVDLFLQSRNWPFGSAIAVTLVAGRCRRADCCHAHRLAVRRRPTGRSGLMRAFVLRGLSVPLRADRAGGAVFVQRRPQCQRVHRLFGRLVRQGLHQHLPAPGAAEQPDHRVHQRGARGAIRHYGGYRHRAHERPRARVVFDGLFAAAIVVPGVVIGIATLVALVELCRTSIRRSRRSGLEHSPPQLALGYGSVIAAHGLFSMAVVTMIVRARIAGLGRDIVEASADLYATPFGDLPADRAAADHAVDPGRLPARLHLFLRRFHRRLLRCRTEDDAADVCLRLDPPRRDARDQCRCDAVLVVSLILILHRTLPSAGKDSPESAGGIG